MKWTSCRSVEFCSSYGLDNMIESSLSMSATTIHTETRFRSTVSILWLLRHRLAVRPCIPLSRCRIRMMRQTPWWSSRSNDRSSAMSCDVNLRAAFNILLLTLSSTNATSSSSSLCSCTTKHIITRREQQYLSSPQYAFLCWRQSRVSVYFIEIYRFV